MNQLKSMLEMKQQLFNNKHMKLSYSHLYYHSPPFLHKIPGKKYNVIIRGKHLSPSEDHRLPQ